MAKSKTNTKGTTEAEVHEDESVETEEPKVEDEVLSTDTQINQTGADAPTVERPSAASKPVAEKPITVDELLAAVRYLAGKVSSNAEMSELRQAFPRVFK